MLSRRQFISRSASGFAVGGLLSGALNAQPLGLPIGCQTYPVREALGKDFAGTLRQLAEIGYQNIEMCSPQGYAKSGYGPLVGLKASEMRRTINDAGLKCESCHFHFDELKQNLDERIAFAKELGLTQMISSTLGVRADGTMADWVRAAHDLNKIGEQTQKAGLQTGFHNHDFEFKQIDGVLVYDKLMSELDPKLVKNQFQVSVISLGYDAATFFTKYPGRFVSIHLQDWSPAEKKQVPVGQGVVDWKKLFAAAKIGGVKNYFVELSLDALKPSYEYLHNLKV